MSEKPPPLLPIFRSTAQLAVLGEMFIGAAERSIGELARRTGVPQATVSREVERLVRAGILADRGVGRIRLVRADTESPLHPELSALLHKVVGPPVVLRELLDGTAGIHEAHIYGSWARRHRGETGDEPADIDVLVVADADAALVRRIREVGDDHAPAGPRCHDDGPHPAGVARREQRFHPDGPRGRPGDPARRGRPVNTARPDVAALLRAGRLLAVPADPTTASARIEVAEQHLDTARLLLDAGIDYEIAYVALYDAARKAITAAMLATGVRAANRGGAHQAVAIWCEERLGDSCPAPAGSTACGGGATGRSTTTWCSAARTCRSIS